MLLTLAFRHLWVRRIRSLFLLLGFAIGVGVMLVLLSVGEAMLDQSRDVSLVGGGEITVLPLGIDVEAMRTGGLGALFFGIDRARYLTRQILEGPRHRSMVRAVSPGIEGKLLYLCPAPAPCQPVAVRAGGEIPSRAAALGTRLDVRDGSWRDTGADSAYLNPGPQRLYDELDRFHIPPRPDSSWGEWQYFNLVVGPDEWWYVTYRVGGKVASGKWGGQILLAHRRPDGVYQRFSDAVPSSRVVIDTSRADLVIGESTVRQRDGVYQLRAWAQGPDGVAHLDLTLHPLPNRYFPPVELSEDDLLSGYVVPVLAGSVSGRICLAGRCTSVSQAPAYHDHNWGVWRDVTWEWGAARGGRLSLLYGGVYGPTRNVSTPFFLALADSMGLSQVVRFDRILYYGSRPARGMAGVSAPERFTLLAGRAPDTLRLDVAVDEALASETPGFTLRRAFLQMRGRFTLTGRLGGEAVSDKGAGFFETYVSR